MTDPGTGDLERFLLQARELNRRVAEECRETHAVMFTDLTASTSFFERHGDFEGLLLLQEYNRLMAPIIAQHGGSIVKSLGDGLLIVFPSPDHACRAALEMQQSTQEVNSHLSGASTITITVAIHVGEIFRYNGDVFGDVINVTARVSSLTNPGTILITQTVKGALSSSEFVASFATRAILKGKLEPLDLYHLHWRRDELAKLAGNQTGKRVRAFVSTVTPHADVQVRFVEAFSRRLFTLGVEPVFLKQISYDKKDPLERVASQIASCDLVIVLGLERSHAYYLKDKELSKHESEDVHRKYTSSWLHLEAGLAYALGKQIFVLCSSDICSDGIFDRAYNTYSVHEFTEHSAFSDALDGFFATVEEWLREFRECAETASVIDGSQTESPP